MSRFLSSCVDNYIGAYIVMAPILGKTCELNESSFAEASDGQVS